MVYGGACLHINSGYVGIFSLTCTNGNLQAVTAECAQAGCPANTNVYVSVGGMFANVVAGDDLVSGSTTLSLCVDVNPSFSGTVTLSCSMGQLSVAEDNCYAMPCETWDYVIGTVHCVSGLVFPKAQIITGEAGVGECGDANIECSGVVILLCDLGQLEVNDTSACRLTCSTYGTSLPVTIGRGGENCESCLTDPS